MSGEQIQNPENTGENRDELGRFKPGHSGNPEGKPEGTISIVGSLKKRLSEVPTGHKKTYLELLIDRILQKAISEGDSQIIKQIWNYIDGMPKQSWETKNDGSARTLVDMIKAIENSPEEESE